jgi:hypothetical protein
MTRVNERTASSKQPRPACRIAATAVFIAVIAAPGLARAQSPELAMRDFSSGQIKKGARSIGFGGDGATWGNYGLVWKDADSGLVDYSDTHFTNGNDFQFYAVGVNTPRLWHDLVLYAIVMEQETNNVKFNTKSPGLGSAAVPVEGTGADQALFIKAAMPLGNGVSAGVLLSREVSHFDASAVADANQRVHYETIWRPSGGFGLAWQPDNKWLLGFRALYNNDFEKRTDSVSVAEGMATSQEYRLGASYSLWKGGLIDVGTTRLEKFNAIAGTHSVTYNPNLGFEQTVIDNRLTLRFGLDETSPTAGLTYRFAPFKLDIAYVYNMAHARVGDLFGTQSNSIFAALIIDYGPGSSPTARPSMRSSFLHDSDFASPGVGTR